MVYFIGNTEYVKIGYSKDLNSIKQRIGKIQTSCPFNLDVFLVIPGDYIKERELHLKFKESKLEREWFKNSEQIKNFISEIPKIENFSISLNLEIIEEEKHFEVDTKKITLKDLRKFKNLSLDDVSKILKISIQSVKEAEDREAKDSITLNTLKKYLEAIGFEIKINFVEMNTKSVLDLKNCPHCNFDLDDGDVYERMRALPEYKNFTDKEVKEFAENHGWSEMDPIRGSKLIGEDYKFKCPNCDKFVKPYI